METDTKPATPEPVVETPTDTTPQKEPVGASPTTTQPVVPTWQEELEKADAKELRKHPKIAGLIGSELQRAVDAERRRLETETTVKAQHDAEEHLRKLAQEDPMAFTEQWLSQDAQHRLGTQLASVKASTRDEYAAALSTGAKALPEWSHVTEDDMRDLATALAGKQDSEVLPIFLKQLVDTVSKYRAKALLEEWRTKELEEQRKAIRNEEAARLMQKTQAPGTTPPKAPAGKPNIAGMTSKEFDELSPPNESMADAIRRLHGST